MKSRAIIPALLAVGLLYLASASTAHAFNLLDRMLGVGGGAAGCCAPEPSCAAPAPSCHAAPSCCAPVDCCHSRGSLLHRLFHSHRGCADACGCDAAPACGCDAAPAYVPEPSCGAPADCGCAQPRRGLLHNLFHHHRKSSCGCDTCDVAAPSCCG